MKYPPLRRAGWACLPLLLAAAACPGVSAAQGAAVYKIDAESSDIHWLVYKAGIAAGLGHNHVISAGGLSGTATRQAEASGSTFELSIPVADLVVDEPALRKRHGADFQSEPSARDIAGTRRHMLGDRVLDAADYPTIRVQGAIASGGFESAVLRVTVQMLGRDIVLSVPCKIAIDGDILTASGEFILTHADLGMKPYKAGLGLLAVAPEIDFFYRVRAIRQEAAR